MSESLSSHPTAHPASRSELVILALILLVALYARLNHLGEIEHNIDHAYPVWQAMQTLDEGVLPLKGQGTSVLFANPALTGYLFIVPVALTRSPLGVYVFVIALNTLAVVFCYRSARLMLHSRLALLAALLVAVNPWMIEYSRTSWVQSLLPFFVTAVAWLLWPVLLGKARKPERRLLLALIMATLLSQTYLLAFFIAAPTGLLMLLFYKRVPWKAAGIGAGIFALALGLYGLGLLGDTADLRQRVDNFSSSESRLSFEAFDSALRLVSGAEYELARGQQAPTDDAALRHDLSRVASGAVQMSVMLGIGAAIYAIIRQTPRRDTAIILLIWFGLPVLAMSYTGSPVHPFYQLMGIPAAYVLAAWGIGLILRPERGWAAALLVGLMLPFGLLMLINSSRYYEETAAIPGAHGLGALPVSVGLELGAAINQYRQPGQIVYADEEAWILNSFSGELYGVLRDVRAPELTHIPAKGALYISFSPAATPAAAPISGRLRETLTLADDSRIDIYELPAAAEAPPQGTPLEIPSQQGLTLVSYQLERDESGWLLQTTWRVDHIAPDALPHIYAPFIHLFDASGQRVAIIDGPGLRADAWRVGWLQIVQMRFTLPSAGEGPFSLQIGQYDGLNQANIIFLPPGAEATTSVILPEALIP